MMARDESKDGPEQEPEEREEPERRGARARLRGVARRLMDEETVQVTTKDAKELVGAVLGASDKARKETIRLIGREVRVWLEGLGLDEGIHYLLTNYSLEVSASVSLKPLKDKLDPPPHARQPERDEHPAER